MVVGGSGWVGERTGAVEEGKWTYRHGLRRVNVSIKLDILTTEIVSYGMGTETCMQSCTYRHRPDEEKRAPRGMMTKSTHDHQENRPGDVEPCSPYRLIPSPHSPDLLRRAAERHPGTLAEAGNRTEVPDSFATTRWTR
jgi:hypothetical protein